jgi:hypothetical protein
MDMAKKYGTTLADTGSFYLYRLTSEELSGDRQPHRQLHGKMESDFFMEPPSTDEGLALANKEAGVLLSGRQLTFKRAHQDGGNTLQKVSLMGQLIKCRKASKLTAHNRRQFINEMDVKKEETRKRKELQTALAKAAAYRGPSPQVQEQSYGNSAFLTAVNEGDEHS